MKNLFKKYINAVISPDEFNQFHDYIDQKESSISVYKMMKSEWEQFLTDKDFSRTNPMLFERIQQAILIEEGVFAKKKLRLYSIGLRIAAVLLIGLLFGSIWLYQQSHSSLESIQTQTISIPYGAKTQFVMPDGSTVWLNSGSTLTYSGNFSKQRVVELKGEAFFDVVKSKVPFVVNTSYGNVKVFGTAFNVQAYPDDSFVTTLERGSVSVADRNKQKLVLTPGEQAHFIGKKLVKNTVNTTLFTSWKDGKLIFNREPFPNMMERLERWFNIKIEYSANDVKDLWFTGTVEMETMTEVMEMICKAAPVSYSFNSQTRIIKIGAKK